LFARIILTCASQHSALTLALSATHYFALEQPGDNQSARLSPETRAFLVRTELFRANQITSKSRGRTLSGNAIGYSTFYSRSHCAVIRVCDDAGNVVETHEHAGDFKEP